MDARRRHERNLVTQRLPRLYRCRCHRPLMRHTDPAFLINALILMALMCNVGGSDARGGRGLRESTEHYQSNYVHGTPLSTGYALSQNYYHMPASSHHQRDGVVGSATDIDIDDDDGTSAQLSSSGSGSNVANFIDLHRFRNVGHDGGFLPTTMTAAGRHYIDGDQAHNTRYIDEASLVETAPQIDVVNAAGQYRTPPPMGKIDYEMNAANYDVAGETSNGGSDDGGENVDVSNAEYGSNDAHNIVALHDLTQFQLQQQQYKQHHAYDYQQQQHQLAFGAEISMPKVRNAVDVNVDIDADGDTDAVAADTAASPATMNADDDTRIVAFKNYAPHAATPTETKHQQSDVVDKQNLHDIAAVPHTNYHQHHHHPKPEAATADLYNDAGIVNIRQAPRHHFHNYAAFQQHTPRATHIVHKPIHHSHHLLQQLHPIPHQHQQHHHNYRLRNHISPNEYTLAFSKNSFRTKTAQQQNSRSLSLNEIDPEMSARRPPLPPITQTVRHTPASAAAIAGIPLTRHVEVVRHIPVRYHQRELIPTNRTVPIEIPDPVITTVTKPLPINVTVPNIVAVSKENVIRIPIERIRPVPVERAVPFLVDRRVPYEVEKQVAKPVFYPYPIRVPVVTTIVHKLPARQTIHKLQKKPRRVFFKEVVTKLNSFG